MKRKFMLRIIAFFLLLVFIPKLGLQLYAHHLLHQSEHTQNSAASSSDSHIQLRCNCLDDATMPLSFSIIYEQSTFEKKNPIFCEYYYFKCLETENIFRSLRAPPPIIV